MSSARRTPSRRCCGSTPRPPGVQLTAQQPEVNLVRVAVQALAAVLGGTQSLHTNSFDEAIALPTEKAARLALRTQQVIAYETDVTKTVDPFAGSYAIESLTDDLEAAAAGADPGRSRTGAARSPRSSRASRRTRSRHAAYRVAQADRRRHADRGRRQQVPLADGEEPYEPLRVDPQIEADQCERLAVLRAERDNPAVTRALDDAADGRRRARATCCRPCARRCAARHRRRGRPRAARRMGHLPATRHVLTSIDRSGGRREAEKEMMAA